MQKMTISNTKAWSRTGFNLRYFLIFLTLSPLLWVLSTSFKRNDQAISFPPKFLPKNLTFDNYVFVPKLIPNLVRSLINSFAVSIGRTLLSVAEVL